MASSPTSRIRGTSRRWRTGVALVSAFASAVALSPAGATTPSASALFSSALRDATSAHWVHERTIMLIKGSVVSMGVNVIGATGGEQRMITANGGSARLIALDSNRRMFINANEPALTSMFGISSTRAASAANHWLVLTPSDPNYASVDNATTLASDFAQISFIGGPVLRGVTTLAGHRVYELFGAVPASNGVPEGSGTLYVTASAKPMPFAYHVVAGSFALTVSWTGWGQGVVLRPPAGAIPFPTK
ncbi:MAG: hypothetical protein KGJ39_03705 [Acidobacteriota bacterium]|nr:hypothetical protein [Acidobacteriota bacterium]